jgi:ribosomal protein L37E
MGCCGRADNRNKKNSERSYYEKHAYLSKAQMAQKAALGATDCATCSALTFNNDKGACSICGNPKNTEPEQQ